MEERAEVVVVGGGVAGLALAWRLAARGRPAVRLVEAERLFAWHASSRNAAIWLPHEADATTPRLARRSAALLDELLGEGSWRRPLPAWLTAGTPQALQAPLRAAAEAGLEAGPLLHERGAVPAALLEEVPVLAGGRVRAAARVGGAAVIDVHRVNEGLRAAATAAGADLRTSARAVGLQPEASGDWRVRLEGGGSLRAGAVVVAAGAWAASVAAGAGLRRALLPLRRHLAVLEPPAAGGDWPLLWHLGPGEAYLRPESGGLLASPCDEEPWAPGEPPVAEDVERRVADALVALAPGLAGARLRRTWACLRTFAPDRELVLGEEPRAPGLWWCAGFGGRGMTVAVGAADLLAAALLGQERLPPEVLPARPALGGQAPRGSTG